MAILPSIRSLLYASGVYSLSFKRHLITDLMILKAGSTSSISAGEDLIIFRMATFNSELSARSGATEKNREKSGSISISRMKMIAELKVLKFFRAISSTAVR